MKVTIAALIYRSTVYADFVYSQIHKHTPSIKEGTTEFFFVANDASDEVIKHLVAKNYPFYEQRNTVHTPDQLFKMGFGKPEYIHRVYRGWNRCIQEAKGDIVVLVNSDMGFSPGWLENLLKHVSPTTIVSSLLIERGHEKLKHFPAWLNGTGSIVRNCGKTPLQYNEGAFQAFASSVKKPNHTSVGGVYMPMAFQKDLALKVGCYPEGNLAGASFDQVSAYGDQVFVKKLADIGVRHITAWDSLAYHFQQGEQEF